MWRRATATSFSSLKSSLFFIHLQVYIHSIQSCPSFLLLLLSLSYYNKPNHLHYSPLVYFSRLFLFIYLKQYRDQTKNKAVSNRVIVKFFPAFFHSFNKLHIVIDVLKLTTLDLSSGYYRVQQASKHNASRRFSNGMPLQVLCNICFCFVIRCIYSSF